MPPNNTDQDGKPVGVLITLRDIHDAVLRIDGKIDRENRLLHNEISKLKAQLAAQWVIHGLLIATLAFVISRGISNA